MKFIDLPQELSVGAARANALLTGTDHITVRQGGVYGTARTDGKTV